MMLTSSDSPDNDGICEDLIKELLSSGGNSRESLIAAYRFYFYSGNFNRALEFALRLKEQIELVLDLPDGVARLPEYLEKDPYNPDLRLLMQTVAAAGFLQARMGHLAEARQTLSFAENMDPRLSFGADAVYGFLREPSGGED